MSSHNILYTGRRRLAVLMWMEDRSWPTAHPRLFRLWDWVVMPRWWGSRLGAQAYVSWLTRTPNA